MLSGWILDLYPSADGMTLWLLAPNQQRYRLTDRSFMPCFYVHGPEARLTCLAEALAARAPVSCALVERTNLWDGAGLRVLQVSVRCPTLFGTLVRFVHRYDSSLPAQAGLRLYNSDLMLAPLYCWEKRVFPLARVEVETGTGAKKDLGFRIQDSGWPNPESRVPSPETRVPKSSPSPVVTTNGRRTMNCRRSG